MKKTIIDEIENMMKKVKKKKRKYIFKKHEKNVNQIDKVFTLFKVNMFKKMNYKNVKYYIRRKGHTMYRYKFRKDYEKKPFVFGSGKLETKEFHNEIKNYIMEMICLKRQQVRHKTRINVIENEVISEFRKQKLLQKTNIINNKFFITERSKSRKEQEKVKSRTQKINKLQKIFNRYNDRREYSLRFHYDPTNPLIANRARLRNVVKNINNVVKKMKSSQSSLLQELKKRKEIETGLKKTRSKVEKELLIKIRNIKTNLVTAKETKEKKPLFKKLIGLKKLKIKIKLKLKKKIDLYIKQTKLRKKKK